MRTRWWTATLAWVKDNSTVVTGVAVLVIGALLLLAYTKPSVLTSQSAVWRLTGDIQHVMRTSKPDELSGQLGLVLAKGLEEFESSVWWRNFARHLALALLVSGFLILIVEVHTRKKAAQEVGRDVLSAILGKVVPPSVFQEVNQLIIKAPYIRKNLTYVFDIRSAAEQLGENYEAYLLFKTTQSWRVHNLSGREGTGYKLRVRLHSDPLVHDAQGNVLAPRFVSLYIDELEVPIEANMLSADRMFLSLDVDLPKSELEFKRVRVEIIEAGYKRDRAFWTTGSLVEGVAVQWTLHVAGLRFGPYLPHPRATEFRPDPDVPNKMAYPGILFPGQAVALEWEISN